MVEGSALSYVLVTLVGVLATAAGLYLKNVIERYNPNYQKEVSDGLWKAAQAEIGELRAETRLLKAEIADVKFEAGSRDSRYQAHQYSIVYRLVRANCDYSRRHEKARAAIQSGVGALWRGNK